MHFWYYKKPHNHLLLYATRFNPQKFKYYASLNTLYSKGNFEMEHDITLNYLRKGSFLAQRTLTVKKEK